MDAQPDESVARKRFWEGSFLFASDLENAGPGFKAFRPLLRAGDGTGPPRPLSNRELVADDRFAPCSDEQSALAPEAFYARMAKLINPDGLAPERAYEDTLDALVEQLETRIGSVDNGERYVREHPAVVPMPDGAQIFETVGPWEDYSTPSRDLRLLIAMNVPSVSKSHCEVLVYGPEVIVRDLGSTNGTFVNGVRLFNQQRQLKPGQIVRFGMVEARLELEPSSFSDTAIAETAIFSLTRHAHERPGENLRPGPVSMTLEPNAQPNQPDRPFVKPLPAEQPAVNRPQDRPRL